MGKPAQRMMIVDDKPIVMGCDLTLDEIHKILVEIENERPPMHEILNIEIKKSYSKESQLVVEYDLKPPKFERIRRVTGYLTGTLDRWNDSKRAEERERVKHDAF